LIRTTSAVDLAMPVASSIRARKTNSKAE